MNITAHDDGDGFLRLALSGDLDMATTAILDGQVTHALDRSRPRRLIIDAAGLAFCDSSGVHALVRARETAHRHGAGFVVDGPQGIARRTLEISGLLEQLTTPAEPGPRPR